MARDATDGLDIGRQRRGRRRKVDPTRDALAGRLVDRLTEGTPMNLERESLVPAIPGLAKRLFEDEQRATGREMPPVETGLSDRKKWAPPNGIRAAMQTNAVLAALWHTGMSYREIGEKTGLDRDQVRRRILRAEADFRLTERLAAVVVKLDGEAVPLAVDRMVETLEIDTQDPGQLARRDLAMYRVLEGRGLLHPAGASANGGAALTALSITFAAPEGVAPSLSQAQIVGVSRAALPSRRLDRAVEETVSARSGGEDRARGGRGEDAGRGLAIPPAARLPLPIDFTD